MWPALLPVALAARPPLVAPPVERPVCAFAASRLQAPAQALLPGTRTRIGQVVGYGDGMELVATLGEASGRPVLRAALRDGAAELVLDLELTGGAPLGVIGDHTWGPLTLVDGAMVDVLGFDGERVRVGPPVWGQGHTVRALRPLAPSLGCGELRIRHVFPHDFDDHLRAKAGAASDATPVAFAGTLSVDGRPAVRVPRHAGTAWEVGRDSDHVHLAVAVWTGAIWRGDAPVNAVGPLDAHGFGDLLGALGRGTGAPPPTYRACAVDVPLHAERGGKAHPIGVLVAGSRFEVLGTHALLGPTVRVPDAGLRLDEGWSLRLFPGAERCPTAP